MENADFYPFIIPSAEKRTENNFFGFSWQILRVYTYRVIF
jgi:hypothetical protein